MNERANTKFNPRLENLEEKQLLSVSTAAMAARRAASVVTASSQPQVAAHHNSQGAIHAKAVKPNYGYLVYRITNPNRYNNHLTPPFGHVMVQTVPPVPGQVYNLLYIAVRNGTAKTFDAGSGFQVKFPGNPTAYPILTGNQKWKPGQDYIFYVLTKQYYPLPNQVTSGFEFNLGGARSIGIPGPSGISVGLKYDPATFNNTLDKIVIAGKGAQAGAGIPFGMPDTAIDEFVSAKTNRNDFGGYF